MAETRAQQEAFEWGAQETAPAGQERTSASPREATRVDVPPRQTASVRVELADGERWLTADEATLYLGLPSRKALYAAVERRQVPCSRLGRRLRFRKEVLDRLLLKPRSRGDQLESRVPSPRKEPERW